MFTVLSLLAERYSHDEIYTWASSTLVAVNPYKDLTNLYYQEAQEEFSNPAVLDIVSKCIK